MPIIKPGPLTGLDFHKPEPGIYRALLYNVTRTTSAKGNLIMRWDWKLLSHPDKRNNYYGFRVYPLKNTGYLSQTLWHWKGYKWKDLEALEPDGQPRPERLVNDEADIEVVAPEVFEFANVDGVWAAGTHVFKAEDGSYSLHPDTAKAYEAYIRRCSSES